MRWLETLLARPVAVLTWATALLLAGLWAAFQVPLEWIPKVELPEVTIQTSWSGASPRAVERYLTAPIERVLQRIPGTKNIESLSEEGRSLIRLQVSKDIDLSLYVAEVNEQLAFLRGVLPDRVVPRVDKEIPETLRDQVGFMTLQVVGSLSPDALRQIAEERVASKLRSLHGVAHVRVLGGEQQEILISLDPASLQIHHLQPSQIEQRLREANLADAYGRIRANGEAFMLLGTAIDRVEDIGRLVVANRDETGGLIRLQDVAKVQIAAAPVRSISRVDGQPVVSLTIDRAPGSNMISLADAVFHQVVDLNEAMPSGIRIIVADNQAEAVSRQLKDVFWRGGLGLICVILVFLCLLRSIQAVTISLFSIAVAFAVSIAFMRPLGLTLNLITIAGLVLVFGLLVDNAVIVVEQLITQRARLRFKFDRGKRLDVEAAKETLRVVWLPLLGGTISTMVVLIPIIYLSGELRILFLPFGILVCLTLGFSLISAGLLIPVLSRFLPLPVKKKSVRWVSRLATVPYKLAGVFPRATLVGLLLALGVPIWTLPETLIEPQRGWSEPVTRLADLYNKTLGNESVLEIRHKLNVFLGGVTRPFFQQLESEKPLSTEDRSELFVRINVPPGSDVSHADSLISRFERTALRSESVRRTLVHVQQQSGFLQVHFTEKSLKTSEPSKVRGDLIGLATQLSGVGAAVWGLSEEGFSRGGIGSITLGNTLEAYGPSYEGLERMIERFAARLLKKPRVVGVSTSTNVLGVASDREVLRLRWDADAAVQSRTSAPQIADVLRTILYNPQRTLYYVDLEGAPRLPVRLVMDESDRIDVDRLVRQPLYLGDSTQIQLQGLAPIRVERIPSSVERYNQQYRRYITMDYRGSSSFARAMLDSELGRVSFPPGYRLQRVNYAFLADEVKQSLLWALLATLGLVYLVLASVFESWRMPFVVLLSVPVALIGVAIGFLLIGVHFTEGAFIGSILLVGVSVNDSILLTDRYRKLRQLRPHGSSKLLALLAVRERLRPMWTTTLTSIAAILPVFIFPNDSDFWMGLAVTVACGLFASTLLAPLASVGILSLRGEHHPFQGVFSAH